MFTRAQWRWFIDHPVVEWSIFAIGVVLILLSPLAGVIPGPGGIFVFAIGLALVLKTSMWAKRREEIRKQQDGIGGPRSAEPVDQGPIASVLPGPPLTPPERPGYPER